jgi:hypothetical protein
MGWFPIHSPVRASGTIARLSTLQVRLCSLLMENVLQFGLDLGSLGRNMAKMGSIGRAVEFVIGFDWSRQQGGFWLCFVPEDIPAKEASRMSKTHGRNEPQGDHREDASSRFAEVSWSLGIECGKFSERLYFVDLARAWWVRL